MLIRILFALFIASLFAGCGPKAVKKDETPAIKERAEESFQKLEEEQAEQEEDEAE